MISYCIICGRNQQQVPHMITGVGGSICVECVEGCMDLIPATDTTNEASERKPRELKASLPRNIKATLDKYVISQEKAKKILSVAIYNHYKRINNKSEVEIQKSNILLTGPTGSGKTLLAQTLAKMLDVPFAMGDATSITESGYVGEDVEDLLIRLYRNAEGDTELAEKGIVYIDETDKIAKKLVRGEVNRDISGEGVQQGLLRMMEGALVPLNPNGKKSNINDQVALDTTNILFIFGGAFSGLEDIIFERIKVKGSMGFGKELPRKRDKDKFIMHKAVTEDFIEFGLIPEFVGRIPVIATLDALTEGDLRRILTEPKNSILKQYQELLRTEGIKLEVSKEALNEVARESMSRKSGARGLRSIIERIMSPIMFDVTRESGVYACTITKDTVMTGEPMLVYGGNYDSM